MTQRLLKVLWSESIQKDTRDIVSNHMIRVWKKNNKDNAWDQFLQWTSANDRWNSIHFVDIWKPCLLKLLISLNCNELIQ